jgi:hypothetical protein
MIRAAWLVFVLLLGGSLTHASPFSRQEDGQVAEFSGTIATVDAVSLRIRPDEGSVMTFVVDDPSSLPLGLAAGTRVSVRYETREGGGRRLLSVSLAPESSAPVPAAAPSDPSATPQASESLPAPSAEPAPLTASAALVNPPPVGPQGADALPVPASTTSGGAGRCPLQLVAVGLLVATGALLVFASWR